MKSTLRPYHQLIIIAIILLIHGGMLMTFVLVQFQSDSFMPPQEAVVMIEEESVPQDRDWVALNSALPNAHHIPQPMQPQERDQHPEQIPQDPVAHNKEESPEPQEKKAESDITEHSLDEAIAIASRMLEEARETKPEVAQEHTKTPDAKNQTENKQIPTLAQITQGFVEHLQHADIAVKSNRDGVASIDQIKHLNYCQKILSCIVNAYQISNHTAPSKATLPNRARIKLALNRNGSIAQLQLQASSGNTAVDSFLLAMFREASSSFPPVPNAISESPYPLPSFSIDTLEVFRSTQGWHIDNTSI